MSAYPCVNCGKLNESRNYCDWDCHVSSTEKAGGKKHLPNGLPIRSIKADGTMLEHEHGDHLDYKFPVEIKYVGPITMADRIDFEQVNQRAVDCRSPLSDDAVREHCGETHALIYFDDNVALTMYECNYAIWSLRDGKWLGGSLLYDKHEFDITATLSFLDRLENEQRHTADKLESEQ